MNVEDLMTKPAATIHTRDVLSLAAENMWNHDCGVLPVVDDAGKLVGVITDRDICIAAWSRGRLLTAIRVEEAMSTDVVSMTRGQDLALAELLMAERQVRRIPIVDADHRPVGILSINDIAREAARTDSRLQTGLSSAIHTLAAICRPHRQWWKAA